MDWRSAAVVGTFVLGSGCGARTALGVLPAERGDGGAAVPDATTDPLDAADGDAGIPACATGSWLPEILDEGVAWETSIALGGSGDVHVVFSDYRHQFHHAHRPAGGEWTVEVLDSGDHIPMGSSIAVDREGRVHVAYAFYSRELRYAVCAPDGSWTFESVESVGGVFGVYPSIALDDAGGVRLAQVRSSPWTSWASRTSSTSPRST